MEMRLKGLQEMSVSVRGGRQQRNPPGPGSVNDRWENDPNTRISYASAINSILDQQIHVAVEGVVWEGVNILRALVAVDVVRRGNALAAILE